MLDKENFYIKIAEVNKMKDFVGNSFLFEIVYGP